MDKSLPRDKCSFQLKLLHTLKQTRKYIHFFLAILISKIVMCCLCIPGITILLSLTVFSLLVADLLPKTSDAIPLLGTLISQLLTEEK